MKAVFLDMEINCSSNDSDCFLDSKAKLHSRKTIKESNQSQKTIVASEIDKKNERIRTTGYYCEHVIDLNKVAALGLRFGRVFFQSYSYLLEWNKQIEVGDWIFNFIEFHDLIYCCFSIWEGSHKVDNNDGMNPAPRNSCSELFSRSSKGLICSYKSEIFCFNVSWGK